MKNDLIRISQAHLNLLETCPPKFQQVYLDKVTHLPNPEIEEKQDWGKRFHLIMQQKELGLSINSLLEENQELALSFKALLKAAPNILERNNNQWREAEHSRTLNFGNYLLTVIYDLLIAETNQAQIIDWKTYLNPPNKNKLARNWQTRLYLYLLVETSQYLPEQVSMTYWFVKSPNKITQYTFPYNSQQYQKTKQDLSSLLGHLDFWLQNKTSFPHRPNCNKKSCPYYQEFIEQQSCQQHKTPTENDYENEMVSLEEIEEIFI